MPAPTGPEPVVNSSARIDTYDPRTGALQWFTGAPRQTPIPSAVFHDRIYLSRGYRNSDYLAIRPGGRGDVTGSHVEWRAPSGPASWPATISASAFPHPAIAGGRLLLRSDGTLFAVAR